MFDVIAIGELNCDYIFTGLKTMPQPGKEIISETFSLVLGSSTAISASQLAKLGIKTAFCSLVGNDANGKMAVEFLKANGIDPCYVVADNGVATGITVSFSDAKDRALVTYKGAMDVFCGKHFSPDILKNTRHVHIGSFFLQTALRYDLPRFFQMAKEAGCTTSLDAGWDDTDNWDYGIRDVLQYTDIFFPNEAEAAHVTGEADPVAAVKKLGARISVVKCGKDGAVAYADGKMYQKRAYITEPVDTTGAGDCFNGGFLYGFLNDKDIGTCLEYGNACGSVCVTKIGGASSCAAIGDIEKRRMDYS